MSSCTTSSPCVLSQGLMWAHYFVKAFWPVSPWYSLISLTVEVTDAQHCAQLFHECWEPTEPSSQPQIVFLIVERCLLEIDLTVLVSFPVFVFLVVLGIHLGPWTCQTSALSLSCILSFCLLFIPKIIVFTRNRKIGRL